MYVVKCKCTHSFQDAVNGPGMRVCNPTTKGKAPQVTVRCTVCRSEHTINK
jgi:hypothetical protein